MKKFFVFLLLFVSIMPCFATNWEQVSEKTWVDLSSWRKEGNHVSAWFKDLNPGDWELIKNKKVWYKLVRFEANCYSNQIGISSFAIYDVKGNLLDSYQAPYTNMTDVIPDSVGDFKYAVLCSLK